MGVYKGNVGLAILLCDAPLKKHLHEGWKDFALKAS
jgi:hypothetical protein